MIKEERFLEIARRNAEQSTHKQRHGAVLVKGGRVLSMGINQPSFNRFSLLNRLDRSAMKSSLHAEIDCLLKRDHDSTVGSTLYVCRINRSGKIRNSQPCPMCQSAAKRICRGIE